MEEAVMSQGWCYDVITGSLRRLTERERESAPLVLNPDILANGNIGTGEEKATSKR